MFENDARDAGGRLLARPITLPFAQHGKPGDRHRTGGDHAAHGHVVSLHRDAARRVGDDEDVISLAERLDRRHREADLVLAALYTEIRLAMPAVQALGEGYDVFIVTDASGGVTVEAHDMAVRRMVAAGAVPITWLAVLGEWQRDWAREETAASVAGVVLEHGGASGVALAWELQLLARRVGSGV